MTGREKLRALNDRLRFEQQEKARVQKKVARRVRWLNRKHRVARFARRQFWFIAGGGAFITLLQILDPDPSLVTYGIGWIGIVMLATSWDWDAEKIMLLEGRVRLQKWMLENEHEASLDISNGLTAQTVRALRAEHIVEHFVKSLRNLLEQEGTMSVALRADIIAILNTAGFTVPGQVVGDYDESFLIEGDAHHGPRRTI